MAETSIDTVSESRYDLSAEDVLQVPGFQHLKGATLAKWRQLGKGPKFVIIGRKAFYSRAGIEEWKEGEADAHERNRKVRKVALPLQSRGSDARKVHRLGGHQTKSQRRQGH